MLQTTRTEINLKFRGEGLHLRNDPVERCLGEGSR
jgi:hypothetical protein